MYRKNISTRVSKVYCFIILLFLIGMPFAACVEGDIVWKDGILIDGNGSPTDIEIDDEDAVVIAGDITPNGKTDRDLCLVKYNKDGHMLWKKIYGGEGLDEIKDIAIDSDRNIIALGRKENFGQIAKYDLNGNTVWMLGNSGDNETGEKVVIDPDGNAYALFTSRSSPDSAVLILRKYDAKGLILWEKEYPESESDIYCDRLLLTKDDTVVVLTRILINGSIESKIIRYDGNNGNKLSESEINSAPNLDATLDSYDNIVTSSMSANFTTISKYSLDGKSTWSVTNDNKKELNLTTMKLDSFNKIFIVGGLSEKGIMQKFNTSGTFDDEYESNSTTRWTSIGIDSFNNIIVSGNEYNKSNSWVILKYEGTPPPPSQPTKLRATIKASPSVVQVCDYVYVTMTVKNIGKSDTHVSPYLYLLDNPESIFIYKTPDTRTINLRPGESHDFLWVYTGKKGRFVFKGYAIGDNDIKSATSSSNAVTIQEPCIASKILLDE